MWVLWRNFRSLTIKKPVRRNAVRRAMRDAFDSGTPDSMRARWLESTGNQDTDPSDWGKIKRSRPTSHAFFVTARPAHGFPVLKWFRRNRFMVPLHLVADSATHVLEVKCLGFSKHEGIYWPDDDLNDEKVREAWMDVLERDEKTKPGAAHNEDLPGRIAEWYLRAIELELLPREGIVALDDNMENLHAAAASPFHLNTGGRAHDQTMVRVVRRPPPGEAPTAEEEAA
jgi:hypothetical protein